MANLFRNFTDRNFFIDFLMILFGIGSWIGINGTFVELPILVANLPEKWSLASYIALIVQIANVAPLSYSALKKIFKEKVNSRAVIHTMMAIGTLSCFLLSFFWNDLVLVSGFSYSLPFFILVFFIATVDCTSSILFFPFVGLFKSVYMSSFLVGESFSGLVPALVALGQGAGSTECRNISHVNSEGLIHFELSQVYLTPKFSFESFCYFLCVMMALSWLSYIFLNYLPISKREQEFVGKDDFGRKLFEESHETQEYSTLLNSEEKMSKSMFRLLLFIQFLMSTIDKGIMTAIQTYSCLPYGDNAFHLTVTLGMLASPTVCVLALIFKTPRERVVIPTSILAVALSSYIIVTAAMSPTPPLYNVPAGQVLIILVWILKSVSISFIKVCIANMMRENGIKALFAFGAVMQLGPAIGSVTSFLLVSVFHLFESANPC